MAERTATALLPSGPGVYRFRDGRGRVLYIGRAGNLRRRVTSYRTDLRDRRHLAPMVARIARLEAVECASEHEAAWLERNLLERTMPPWNRTAGGQEVPLYVRLDARADPPTLRLAHTVQGEDGVRYFGPYLGGNKMRRAIAALNRVFPVSYAGAASSGFQRDMARIRGVAPTDRDGLIQAVTAVLAGDPAMVTAFHAELAHRRDSCARALAFESAATLQAELVAAEWALGAQRVTREPPYDLDVHGWADGVEVSFEIRHGRLNAWRQRPRTRPSTRSADPPAEWAEFAQATAALAARLMGGTWRPVAPSATG